MNIFLNLSFRIHDFLADFLAKYMFPIKRLMLVAAHLAIFGFFFPELRKEFGELAFDILFLLLFLSPLSKIFRMRLLLVLMSYRRQMGILMAYLATVHGLGYLSDPVWSGFVIQGKTFLQIDPRFLFGIGAYFLTLPLLLTSNNLALRLLGRNWKRVHFLVYGVFVLAAFHKFTVGHGVEAGSVLVSLLFIAFYVLLKVLANTGLPWPFSKISQFIASQYKDYSLKKSS